MAATESVHNIIILGASFAGLRVAHGVLKGIPALEAQTKKTYKVTLIANSSRFWYAVGAPRAMLRPWPKSNDDSFIPVVKGLEQYGKRAEFIHAEITGLDASKREVFYKVKIEDNRKEDLAEVTSSLNFSTLIIATGTTAESPLYGLKGSYIPTYQAYEDVQARLPAAKSVLVVGGGSAGVETAGELGHLHGKQTDSPKDITILSGQTRLLSNLRESVGQRAEQILSQFGVKTIHNLRLTEHKKLPNGGEEITLSDGSTRKVDLLIIATGRFPANSYLKETSLLNEKGKVITDEYLRVPGVESAYATGDIASISPMGLVAMQTLVPTTVANVIAELSGKNHMKKFQMLSDKEIQIVPIGPNGGVGVAFGWWLPSFAVKMIKAKTFMFSKAEETVMG